MQRGLPVLADTFLLFTKSDRPLVRLRADLIDTIFTEKYSCFSPR